MNEVTYRVSYILKAMKESEREIGGEYERGIGERYIKQAGDKEEERKEKEKTEGEREGKEKDINKEREREREMGGRKREENNK